MIYVLDTDILSLLAHQDSPEAPRIRRRIAELPADDSIATTVINYEEQMRGWMALLNRARSARSEIDAYARLLRHLATFRRMTVLAYDEAAAKIVERFRGLRTLVGAMDLKIAAIVIASDGILVSRNSVDFGKITGLRTEDWSAE
ncbi:MAG: type II toxin-antitoxin system VapC family toxin [Tepidisphaeraceae bacterium]|jgi:tRNA(fMet)-specific endonuclease VapC